jgi:hypothetical protein
VAFAFETVATREEARPPLLPSTVNLLCLGKGTENVRHGVELAFTSSSLQFNLVPFPGLQQPLIRRPADIASIEEMWPNEIDRTCNR